LNYLLYLCKYCINRNILVLTLIWISMEDLVYICDLNVMYIRMYTLHNYVILKCFLGHTALHIVGVRLSSVFRWGSRESPCPFMRVSSSILYASDNKLYQTLYFYMKSITILYTALYSNAVLIPFRLSIFMTTCPFIICLEVESSCWYNSLKQHEMSKHALHIISWCDFFVKVCHWVDEHRLV